MDKLESFHFDEALRSSNPNPDIKEFQPQTAPGKWDVSDTELEEVEFAKELSLEYQRLSSENSASSDHAAVAATPQAQAAWPTPHQFSSGKSRFAATPTAQPTPTAQRHSARRPGFWPGGDERYQQCAKCLVYLPTGCFGDWMVLAQNKNRQSNRNHQKLQCDACLANFVPTSFDDCCAEGEDCSDIIDKHLRLEPID